MRNALKSCCAGLALAMALGACALPTPTGDPVLQSDVSVTQGRGAIGKLEITVLSSRAEHISGGDALVGVKASEGGNVLGAQVTLNGREIGKPLMFDPRSNMLLGVVTGLNVGNNTLQVVGVGGATASKVLVNHPETGPILSGPHLTPYECRTVESGLGRPTDANCSAPVRYDWFYKPTGGGAFKPLDAGAPRPADLAMTTTIEGKTLPYIVRVESGVLNRSIYRVATLDDPASDAFGVDEGWNKRLAVTFGGGAGTQYNQGTNLVTSALNDLYLSRGFAFMNSTELVNQQHGNAILQGETLMMLKEHFIESYGVPKWTVGTGGSGGAIQQMVITQIYPGLLDGLQPSLSFPDSTMNTADCGVLQNFWKTPAGKTWPQEKKTAVEGYTPGTCGAWERSFVPVMMATNAPGCALNDKSLIYDPVKNPKGARCTIADMRANIYGRDPRTGFARKPQDNVGIQYGLKGLNDGAITVDEFLQLNEKIGGNDVDGNFVAARSIADPEALKAVYASGLINSFGGGIANVPILHSRPYTDAIGDIHDRHRDLTIRARIEKANGRSDNQVIWTAGAAARGATSTVNLAAESLDTMTRWLDAMAADTAPLSTDKVVRHKPAEAVDAYWTADGVKVAEKASWDGKGGYNETYPNHLEPRLIAGAPVTNDVMKCQLKPVDFAAYKATFSTAQQKRMKAVFPDGVCDYAKPGVGAGPIKGTYVKY
ncbi:MAG: DUF6351 family protein [Alphaproteobacteria bacterium]|nr:DUF6351 family protein [Alphaproteobacteria bacterium]